MKSSQDLTNELSNPDKRIVFQFFKGISKQELENNKNELAQYEAKQSEKDKEKLKSPPVLEPKKKIIRCKYAAQR